MHEPIGNWEWKLSQYNLRRIGKPLLSMKELNEMCKQFKKIILFPPKILAAASYYTANFI